MSDRYGYNGRRNARGDSYSDQSRNRYDDRYSSGSTRSSSGSGAYRNSARGNSSRYSSGYETDGDDSWYGLGYLPNPSGSSRSSSSAGTTGSANRNSYSRTGSRYLIDNYDKRSGASGSFDSDANTSRPSSRRTASGYGSRSTGDYNSSSRSSSRRSTDDYGSRQSTRYSTRETTDTRSSSRRNDTSTQSRYSRSSYGSSDRYSDDYERESRSSTRSTSRSQTRSSYGTGTSNTRGGSSRYDSERTSRSGGYASSRSSSSNERLSMNGSIQGGRGRQGSHTKRNLFIVLAVVFGVLLVGAVAAFAYVGSITGNLHEGVDDDLRNALVETDMAKEPFYMLLLGVDKAQWREGTEDGGMYHSDTMILARIDAPNKKISLVSIPRDTLVDMGEYGWQKINAAYGVGGPSYAVETVSKLLGVDISHYAEVDIDGLRVAIDSIGGIEVEVPIEIDDEDAGGHLDAGWQTLNGGQAMILCRSRNACINSESPDIMRAANQRMVLSAIAHKLLASDIGTIANTVSAMSSYVSTDLELNDIIGLAQALQGLDTSNDFYSASLPSHSAYIVNGHGYPSLEDTVPTDTVDPSVPEGWYCIMETKGWEAMKKRMDEGLPPAEGNEVDAATGTVLTTAGSDAEDLTSKDCWITLMNGTDRDGLATRALGLLNADGFENVTVTDAPDGYTYDQTLVIYNYSSNQHQAEMIVKALGQGSAVLNDGSWYLDNSYLVVIGDDWQNVTGSSNSSTNSTNTTSSTGTTG